MADNNDNLGDVSKISGSLRARKINSLHRTVDDVVQQQNRRRIQTNNQIKEAGLSSEAENSYNGILKSLGRTIEHLSTGVKKITIDTSKATTDAIGQYGKAVGEDISINKTNTVAMALSKSTPLFGYFAAKFMETDVFKDSANKIKQNIGTAMHEGISKASGLFSKGSKAAVDYGSQKNATVEDLQGLKDSFSNDIPKLQTGGYVKEGGIAELHAAEVVTPIDKLYRQFGEILLLQKEQQSSMTKIFTKEFRESRELQSENQNRLIKSFDGLRAGLIGSANKTRVAWEATLLEHPSFRQMMLFADIMKTAIVTPIKWLFGLRGGYKGDVAQAMSSSNVFLKQANISALIYTGSMTKLDQIIQYTRASAEAMVGEKIAPNKDYSTYTMWERIKASLTSRTIPGQQKTTIQKLSSRFGLDESSLKDAGIEKLSDFLNIGKIFRSMGVNVENLKGKFKESADGGVSGEFKKAKKRWQEKTRSFYDSVAEKLKDLVGMKQDQEKREGPHSPSMAQNIASTATVAISEETQNKRYRSKTFGLWNKIKKSSVMQSKYMKSMRTHLRKLKGRMWDIMLFAAGFLKNIFSKGFGLIQSLLTGLGLGGVGAGIKGLFGKFGAKGAKGVLGGITKKTGAKGIISGVGKFAGRAAGAVSGVAVGGGMAIWDIARAIISGDEVGFVGNFITRGLAGFLGGRGSGVSGAIHGATKGAAIGGAATAVLGPGAAIGAAFGAIAGGILGFVGGKNVSKGLSKMGESISNITGAIWKLVKFPFQLIREGLKSVYILGNFTRKKIGKMITNWWESEGIVTKTLHWITDKIMWVINKIKTPFVWLTDQIPALLSKISIGDGFMNNLKAFGSALLNFPKYLIQDTYKKLVKIPVIGKYIKKALDAAGGFVKDVQTGELSAKLERTLNSPIGNVTKIPDDIKNQLNEQGTKDVSTRQNQTSGIIIRDNINKTIQLKLEQQRNEELKKELTGIKEGTENTGRMMIQTINTNNSSSSQTSNTVNNGGGGSNGQTSFSNSQALAAEIALCNVK